VFVFKLQSVLEHRKTMEEIALREFSDATAALNAERITMTALAEKGDAPHRTMAGSGSAARESG